MSYFNGTNTSYEYARKYIKKPGIFDVRQGLLCMQACTQQKIQNVLQFYDELPKYVLRYTGTQEEY